MRERISSTLMMTRVGMIFSDVQQEKRTVLSQLLADLLLIGTTNDPDGDLQRRGSIYSNRGVN